VSSRVLALAALALVLGAADVWLAREDELRERRDHATPVGPLVVFDPAAVTRLALVREGQPPLVVEREGSGWVVASARRYPARAGRADAVLARVLSWRRDPIAGAAARTEAWRLEKAVDLELRGRDGVLARLSLGGLSGIDPEVGRRGGGLDTKQLGRFVRVAGEEQVYVLPELVSSELEPTIGDWLARPLEGAKDEALPKLVPTAVAELAEDGVTGLAAPRATFGFLRRDGTRSSLAIGADVGASETWLQVEGAPCAVRVERAALVPLLGR
jgi:hypothetical protein